jgi:hypothetical protein
MYPLLRTGGSPKEQRCSKSLQNQQINDNRWTDDEQLFEWIY